VEHVSGTVEIRAREPVRAVYSPTHTVDVRRSEGDRRARVSFESGRSAEPRDFQLFYTPSPSEVGASLFTYREPGKDGYFLLLLSPPTTVEEREYAAKDVAFVLDISGSMSEQGKIDKARRALEYGIRGLHAGDRFNVVAFSGDTRLMESGLVPASEAGRRRGMDFVEHLSPGGGTNINDALLEALRELPRDPARPRMVVFLTDGLPTVGETNVDNILRNVRAARREGVRLFAFGVGYDVNTRLLDRVAAENGGTADYVDPSEDLEVKVSAFFDKVNHPVLSDLRLDLGAVESDRVYPRDLPDLFRGTQLALVGRYRNDADLRGVTLRLTGSGPVRRVFAYPGQRFPLRAEDNDWLPRLWATRRVGWLMEQVRGNGEQKELVDEIVDLGTRYGIVTPYTSYLAVEPGQENVSPPGAPPPPPVIYSPQAAGATTGKDAVQQSRAARAQQEAVTVDAANAPAAAGIQHVGDKTFYLRQGVWTDAQLTANTHLPETVVTFGSDDYYALLRRVPALARYFALGEQVAVVLDGRVYRVRAATP
jgi:Ca-activated chloride channel family protein